MGFTFLKKLPTPAEIRNQYPIDAAIQELKTKRDQEIRDVFTGKSDKFLRSLVHVLLTTKMLYVITFFVCAKFRIRLLTKY